jgi:hypothetical protein
LAKKRKPWRPRGKAQGKSAHSPSKGSSSSVKLRCVDGQWEFVHPRCARDRQDDLEEVEKMILADETEVAVDELRYLLNGCTECIAIHRMLGDLALSAEDISLARGHYGYAYKIGHDAIRAAKVTGPLPYAVDANQDFFLAGKQLVWCLLLLQKKDLAIPVQQEILRLDPTDPLAVRELM